MDLIERTIQVTWPQRVLFTDHVFDPANPLLRGVLAGDGLAPRRKTLVVVDQTLAAADPGLADAIATYFTAHADAVALVCPPLVVEGGEPGKNSWQAVTQIHAAIDAHHIDRQSYVLAVGGGALLDVAGFAAATAHRGVRHVRVPTTTLSQCDSGVGVKNGINAFGKKNFVGTFAPPWAVLNDFQLLATLAPRDKRGGYAEAVRSPASGTRPFSKRSSRTRPRCGSSSRRRCGGSSGTARSGTWTTSPTAAIRSKTVRRGRWILATGRPIN
jgi:3-dehydroquinate synthase